MVIMDNSVKAIVARACDGRYPKMFGEYVPPPRPARISNPEPVASSAVDDGPKPPELSAEVNGRPPCKHTILEISIRPCLKCDRLCNCGFTYFPEAKYPDILVRSLDGHLVQLSGEVVRASETLRGMVDKYHSGKRTVKLEINVVVERGQNGDFNHILKYWRVDENGVPLEGAEGVQNGRGNDQVVSHPEANDQRMKRPSFAGYPIRDSARNFAKLKAEAKKRREKAKETKADPPAPSSSSAALEPSTDDIPPPPPPLTTSKAKKRSRVPLISFQFSMPPLFRGREFTHPRFNDYVVEEPEESTTPIADLIELDERNSKVLALFDRQSKRPTLGICKDTLLKIQYFMSTHLDHVQRKVDDLNRLFHFQDTSKYSTSLFSAVCDMKLCNSFVYDNWEEDFFNQMDPQTFFDMHQANSELFIWDLYMALEKWVFLNRGFPQEMDNGFLDLMEEKPEDCDQEDERVAMFGRPLVRYPNPYRISFHLCGKAYPQKLPVINSRPVWFRIIKSL